MIINFAYIHLYTKLIITNKFKSILFFADVTGCRDYLDQHPYIQLISGQRLIEFIKLNEKVE